MSGHLGVKSGPLAPTSCKLSKQMLVLQHMNAHYKNLQNVKSSIDMSTPKTLSTSVKSRDKMRRQQGSRGRNPNSRPTSSRPSSRPSSRASNSGDHFSSNQAYADDPIVDQIVREALSEQHDDLHLQLESARAPPRSPYAAKRSPGGAGRRVLYDSARSSRRPASAKADTTRQRNGAEEEEEAVAAAADAGGDVLDVHKNRFTEARPFQPRLLRKNVPSKLSQFRYYSKPKPISAGRRASAPTGAGAGAEPGWGGEEEKREEKAHVEDADPDKVRWLVQQAESARLRQDMGRNTGPPIHDSSDGFALESSNPYDRVQAKDLNGSNLTSAKQRVQEEEEELKYLQFYSDVTDDVLNRGIFTNKVLNQVFEHHLERNKHGLRISKMREILQNIRSELGIPEDDRLEASLGFAPASNSVAAAQHEELRPTPVPRLDLQEGHSPARNRTFYQNTEVEESDLAICQVRSASAEDSNYEVTDLGAKPEPREISEAPPVAAWRSSEAPPMDVAPPSALTNRESASSVESALERRQEKEAAAEAEGERREEELLTTQDEADLVLMQETMQSAIQRSGSLESLEGNDVPDASAERENWLRKSDLNDSTNLARTTNDETYSLSSTTQSDAGSVNPMTMTLRPGNFDTMLQTRRTEGDLPPLARTRMGKSVTFASQDEVLADSTRIDDSDVEGATLTEVSMASSSLEMGSLRRSLPSETSDDGFQEAEKAGAGAAASASTDYDDDFEDDDGF